MTILRSVYHSLINSKIFGQLVEFSVALAWGALKNWRLNENKLEEILSVASSSETYCSERSDLPKLVISNRGLLFSEFSGVVNWLSNLSVALINEGRSIEILCQGGWVRTRKIVRSNLTIVMLPIFLGLRIEHAAHLQGWRRVVRRYLRSSETKSFSAVSIIAGTEGLAFEDYEECTKHYLLLVTNDGLNRQARKRPQMEGVRAKRVRELEITLIKSKKSVLCADTHQIAEELCSVYGMEELKYHYLPIGFPEDRCRKEYKKEKVLLFIGRCDFRKNLRSLLEAWLKIKSDGKFQNWTLVVLTSPGDDLQSWRFLKRLRRPDIKACFSVNELDKHDWLRRSTALAVPSHFESFGMTIIEAKQHYVIPICTRVGGMIEVCGPQGFFFESSRTLDIAKGLENFEYKFNQSKSDDFNSALEWRDAYSIRKMIDDFKKIEVGSQRSTKIVRQFDLHRKNEI